MRTAVSAPQRLIFSLCMDAVNERRDGWAGRQQHHSRCSLHQHPQADHVRTHVPENADASHRPGDGLCDEEQDLHADCAGCDRPRERLIVSVICRTEEMLRKEMILAIAYLSLLFL